MPRGELKGFPDRDAQKSAWHSAGRPIVVVGECPECVDVLLQLKLWELAQDHEKKCGGRRRGRPFDPEVLESAASLIMETGIPLRAGSKSRAAKTLVERLGWGEERARSVVDRLVKISRRVQARRSFDT